MFGESSGGLSTPYLALKSSEFMVKAASTVSTYRKIQQDKIKTDNSLETDDSHKRYDEHPKTENAQNLKNQICAVMAIQHSTFSSTTIL